MKILPVLVYLSLLCGQGLLARVVSYDLTIAQEKVNITGKPVPAMTLNGGIPGPTLRFTEGDTAVIHVRNAMTVPTSIHWHGMLVPNDMDGVPFVTFPPIRPGTTFTYRFPIRQHGTFWYHSHTMLQEQRGVYGSLVISPKARERVADREHVVVLSDWTNRDPHEVLRNLRRGTEYYNIEKGTDQSILGAAKTGKLSEYFGREAMRMPAMDLGDVSYDAFLVNGKREEFLTAAAGRTIRLRIIDASASTFFHLSYAGGPFTIISADGQRVRPLKMTKPLLIGVAETYDVLVRVPPHGTYEFRATAHDGSGYASLWIGSGEKHSADDLPMPFVYDTMMGFNAKHAVALTPAGTMGMSDRDVDQGKFDSPGMHMHGMKNMEMPGMDHSMMDHAGMAGKMEMGVKHNPPAWYDFLLRDDAARAPRLAEDGMKSAHRPFAPYAKLRSLKSTAYPASAPRREIRLTLDGDMERFVWMINDQPVGPENDIHIRHGEVVRFIMINRTMMHHPMHLHGHFFRVINGQGDHSPLKHTVDVEPMATTVIEFMADEPGDWFFHCHMLYHMMSGMARVVEYEGFTPAPETAAIRGKVYEEHNHWFFYGMADVLSSQTQGTLEFSNPLNILALQWEAGWQDVEGIEWEGDLTYARYLNRFTQMFAGVYAEGIDSTREHERLIAGVHYLWPGNFHSRTWIDSDGGARVTLEREFMLTPRLGLFGEGEYDTREKWTSQAGLSYILNEYLSATVAWDSDFGWGAGVTVKF
jgi:CopA family copper-resistance protein